MTGVFSTIVRLTHGRVRLRPFLALAIAFAVAQGLSFLAVIPVVEAAIDQDWGRAGSAVAVLAGLALLSALLFFFQARKGYNTSLILMRTLQHRLGDHAARLPLGWFDRARAGQLAQLTSKSAEDAGAVTSHLLEPIIAAVVSPLTVVIGLLRWDWRVSLAGAAFIPIAVLVGWLAPRVTARVDARLDRDAVDVNEQVIDFALAQPLLRSSGRGVGTYPPLDESLAQYSRTHDRGIRMTIPGMLFNTIAVQLWLVLLVVVTLSVTLGAEPTALPGAVAIGLLIAAVRFVDPLTELSELANALRGANDALARIAEVLDTVPLPEPKRPAVVADRDLEVEFDDVGFRYTEDSPEILTDLSFSARPGTMTALVGPSGAGKTTILRLLARFYDVSSGAVRLGGVDVRDLGSDAVIDRVAIVFQDVYLFEGSIRDNVRQGRPDASDEEVERAISLARVTEIGERLPEGLDTQVGEGGARLSGGERQRVSVARALLKNSPIVLLDEATAALDAENEAALTDAFSALARGRTVIAIVHQLETIRGADQILFVDEGRIVESGDHARLMAQDGRYARFWRAKRKAVGWRLDGGAEREAG